MSRQLDRLRNTGWELTPLLHGGQRCFRSATTQELSGQQVCGGNGILNRKVNSDSASGRHGMGCIADAHQSRPVPAPQPIDLHGQDLDVLPIVKFIQPITQIRSDAANVRAECVDTACFQVVKRTFFDYRNDPSGKTLKTEVCGTYTDLDVATARLHSTLLLAGKRS